MVASHNKNLHEKPSQGSLEASNRFKTKKDAGFIPLVGEKLNTKGDVVATKENHILGLSLTISTLRMEPITSKEMVSDEASVLAKSRSEWGS